MEEDPVGWTIIEVLPLSDEVLNLSYALDILDWQLIRMLAKTNPVV